MKNLLLIILTLFSACVNHSNENNALKWTNQLEEYLEKEADTGDSTACQNYKSGRISSSQMYSKGHIIIEDSILETGVTIKVSHLSRNGLFELKSGYYENGEKKYKCYYYNGKGCGVTTYWNENKSILYEGVLYNNTRIGCWKIRDSYSNLKDTNYRNLNLFDSLQLIKIY